MRRNTELFIQGHLIPWRCPRPSFLCIIHVKSWKHRTHHLFLILCPSHFRLFFFALHEYTYSFSNFQTPSFLSKIHYKKKNAYLDSKLKSLIKKTVGHPESNIFLFLLKKMPFEFTLLYKYPNINVVPESKLGG